MQSPVPDHYWEARRDLTTILEQVNLTIFEWLCLDASPRWIHWETLLGEAIYQDVVSEDHWSYSSRSGALYLPDMTREKMVAADQSIRSSGLITRVNHILADAMLAERRVYDDRSYVKED